MEVAVTRGAARADGGDDGGGGNGWLARRWDGPNRREGAPPPPGKNYNCALRERKTKARKGCREACMGRHRARLHTLPVPIHPPDALWGGNCRVGAAHGSSLRDKVGHLETVIFLRKTSKIRKVSN